MWTYQLGLLLCYNITILLLADHEILRNCRFNMLITDSMILRTNALKGTKVDPGPHLHIRRKRIKGSPVALSHPSPHARMHRTVGKNSNGIAPCYPITRYFGWTSAPEKPAFNRQPMSSSPSFRQLVMQCAAPTAAWPCKAEGWQSALTRHTEKARRANSLTQPAQLLKPALTDPGMAQGRKSQV